MPLLLVPLYEFVVWLIGFVMSNKLRIAAFATVGDALSDGGFEEVWRRLRAALAAILNAMPGSEFEFSEADFTGFQSLGAALTREVSKKAGIPLRNVLDKELLQEDLEQYALAMVEQRTNIRLSSLRDVNALRADFVRIAGGVITERTGIPLTDITNPEQVKLDVMSWAKDQVLLEVGEDVHSAVSAEWKNGVSMLKMVRERTGKNVSPKALLRGVNDAMVARYMVKVEQSGGQGMSKQDRRRLQNKMAQRKFRARADRRNGEWDGRQGAKVIYVPKGWAAAVTPPSSPVKKLGRGRSVGLQRKL